MRHYLRLGWTFARRSGFLLTLLFLYQFAWGLAILSWVKDTAVPILHRYPGGELPEASVRLFWLEAEFQLTKTPLAEPYIRTFLLLLLARMLFTPLLNAGICSVLCASGKESARRAFFAGVRRHAGRFLMLYGLQALLTFAPLAWAIPWAAARIPEAFDWTEAAAVLLPLAAGWFVWQGVLDLVFLYAGFGVAGGTGAARGAAAFARRALPAAAVALAVFGVSFAVSAAVSALSLWQAGWIAFAVHQAYPLVRALLKLWGIGAQFRLWETAGPETVRT